MHWRTLDDYQAFFVDTVKPYIDKPRVDAILAVLAEHRGQTPN